MQVPDECLASARRGRAADLRVIFTNGPINELHAAGYIAKAFSTLFSTGAADCNSGHRVRVTLLDHFQHLLNTSTAALRFLFLAYNTQLLYQSLRTGQMYASMPLGILMMNHSRPMTFSRYSIMASELRLLTVGPFRIDMNLLRV